LLEPPSSSAGRRGHKGKGLFAAVGSTALAVRALESIGCPNSTDEELAEAGAGAGAALLVDGSALMVSGMRYGPEQLAPVAVLVWPPVLPQSLAPSSRSGGVPNDYVAELQGSPIPGDDDDAIEEEELKAKDDNERDFATMEANVSYCSSIQTDDKEDL
jgi:hypothetical protein